MSEPKRRLTGDERESLWRAGDHHPTQCDCSDDEHCEAFDDTVAAVEQILAAREAALRAQIKADLLAKCPHVHKNDAYAEACEDCGYWVVAARIAGGDQ